ncbi:MAG: hypothetical protein ACRCSP_03840 [Rhodoglobus sp.]
MPIFIRNSHDSHEGDIRVSSSTAAEKLGEKQFLLHLAEMRGMPRRSTLATGDWRLATGDWRLATGDWTQ